MWTDLILALGKFFKWSFQILPAIGPFMNVVLTLVGIALLVWWTMILGGLGDGKDKEFVETKKPPFFKK